MSDYIKRDEALHIIASITGTGIGVELIKELPSADVVERKKGEWMFDDPISADFGCSECLHRQDYCTRYCPNCGALMWEEDEET